MRWIRAWGVRSVGSAGLAYEALSTHGDTRDRSIFPWQCSTSGALDEACLSVVWMPFNSIEEQRENVHAPSTLVVARDRREFVADSASRVQRREGPGRA